MKKIFPILCFISFICSILFVSCSGDQKSAVKASNAKDSTMVENVVDSLDIILGKEVFESRGRAGVRLYGEYHKLTRAEVEQTKELLKNHMDSLIALPDSLLLYENKFRLMEKPYPLSKYVRQYLAAQQGDNILVWVNLIGTSEDGSIDTFFDYNYIIWVEDGGPRFGEALVDLTRKKIIYLSINSRE